MIIYYVGADLSFESRYLLHNHFGTEMPHPHATIIYSRKWFPYKTGRFYPLVLEPPYSLEILRENLVLRFENYRFFNRYIQLRNLGAISDYEEFKPHITISHHDRWDLENFPLPKFTITLSNEYYGTWEEKEKE